MFTDQTLKIAKRAKILLTINLPDLTDCGRDKVAPHKAPARKQSMPKEYNRNP